jgi:hypothetical protein
MKNFVLVLVACLACGKIVKADVVMTGTAGGQSSIFASSGEFINIKFTTGDAWSANPTTGGFWRLDNFQFNGASVVRNNGDWTVALLNSDSTSTLVSQSFTGTSSNGSGVTTLDLTSFSNILLDSTVAYNLKLTFNGGGTGGLAVFANATGITANAAQPTAAQFTTFTYTNSFGGNNSAFVLNASAVPEPGTLLLGGIAACSGAAGAWWKRRKRKATQPETTDQPATA